MTLALASVKEELLDYIVLMYLITILRILPYRVSREVGLVPVFFSSGCNPSDISGSWDPD